MTLHYVYTKLKFDGHRSMIVARNKPNWFERLLLGRKTEVVQFVGSGTRWGERDATGKIVPIKKRTAKRLQAIEAGVIQDHNIEAKRGYTFKKAIK